MDPLIDCESMRALMGMCIERASNIAVVQGCHQHGLAVAGQSMMQDFLPRVTCRRTAAVSTVSRPVPAGAWAASHRSAWHTPRLLSVTM